MTKPKKPKALPHPFAQLIGMGPGRLPQTTSKTVVLEGKVVRDLREVAASVEPPQHPEDTPIVEAEKQRLAQVLKKAREAAKYQRLRQNPELMAKRQAWEDAHREERRAYMAAYRADPANRERINAAKLRWQKRAYAANPEKYRQDAREYRQAKRDEINAKARERSRAYYAANRELINARRRERISSKQSAEADPTPKFPFPSSNRKDQ